MHNRPEARCRFHHSERHDDRSHPDTSRTFTGCAFPPPDTGEKKSRRKPKDQTAIQGAPTHKEGHLDCGCAEVDALEDFFLYKTTLLCSTNPRIQKTFSIQGVISPVERASLLNAFRSPIHIPMRLRYTGVNGWPDLAGQWMRPSYELDLLRKCRILFAMRIHHLEDTAALNAQFEKLEKIGDELPVIVKRGHEGDYSASQTKKLKAE